MIEKSYLSYVATSITALYIRLLIALIGQYKSIIIRKAPIESGTNAYAHPVCRMMRLKQHRVTARSSAEVQSTEERDIDA